MLSGDNGILQRATDAKTETEKGQEKEIVALAYNSAIAKKVSNGNSSAVTDSELNEELDSSEATASGNPIIVTFIKSGNAYKIDSNGNIEPSVPRDPNAKMTVAEAKVAGTIFDDNTILIDDYENEVVVPKGFKIASGATGSATSVTKGVVIEDATYTNTIGSQFVWIPVGSVTGKDYTETEKTETITLGRYSFNTSNGNPNNYSGDWKEEDSTNISALLNTGNTIAKNINEFISKTNSNGGFYIGRYEARKDTNEKLTEKLDDSVYIEVTQPQAANLSRNMYKVNSKVI